MSKRLISFICIVVMVATVCSFPTLATDLTEEGFTRTVDPARSYVCPYACSLRETPSTSGTFLRTVPEGNRVTGTSTSNSGWTYTSGSWTKVIYIDTGYIRNDLLIPANKSFSVTTSAGLRMRSSPGNGSVVETLPYGTRLCRINNTNYSYDGATWYYVRAYLDGERITGYVHSGYIAINYGGQ